MLSFTATNDINLLNELSQRVFGEEFGAEVGFVLYEEETPVGVARLTVTPEKSVLKKIGVVSESRGQRYGDFFTRSLLNAASGVSKVLEIAYKSDYFKKFGFEEGEDCMTIKSENLTFPCECGHK